LNFEEQILEAAKSIATATAALVKAASLAQRELVEQGKVSIMCTICEHDNVFTDLFVCLMFFCFCLPHGSFLFFVVTT